jgi:hypothetical protein
MIEKKSEGTKKSELKKDPPATLPKFLEKSLLSGVSQVVGNWKYHSQDKPEMI